jgi:hypothetical protein
MVINKPLLLGLSCLLFLQSQSTRAQDKDNNIWRVQPNTCIVESLGDYCELALSINLPLLPEGEYCYYQNLDVITCFNSSKPVLLVEMRFNEYTLLTLRDKSQQILFTQAVDIKTRKTKKKLRRVRDPWRLF